MLKRKLLLVLSIVFVLAAISPATAMAADKIDAVKSTNWKKYDTPLPQNGTQVTGDELEALAFALPNENPRGRGGCRYVSGMSIYKDKQGRYTEAGKYKMWEMRDPSTGDLCFFTENVEFKGYYPRLRNKIVRNLEIQDGKTIMDYYWIKGKKTGYTTLYKIKKSKGKAYGQLSEWWPDEGHIYTVYLDEVVLGEPCIVFRDQAERRVIGGEECPPYTDYHYVSRKTGRTLKVVSDGVEVVSILLWFNEKYMPIPKKLCKVPAHITFKQAKPGTDFMSRL